MCTGCYAEHQLVPHKVVAMEDCLRNEFRALLAVSDRSKAACEVLNRDALACNDMVIAMNAESDRQINAVEKECDDLCKRISTMKAKSLDKSKSPRRRES